MSILSLFASPRNFASDLARRLDAPEEIREGLLRDSVQPYLQRATEERDEFTNLRLIDVWRYCRYTWSLPLNSQPGRKMFYLVRDRSRRFHPIIGIGALGSSVVQITSRDQFVGWSVESLKEDPDKTTRVRALEQEIERTTSEVFWEDLLSEEDIVRPTDGVLDRLTEIADDTPPVNRSAKTARGSAVRQDTYSGPYRRKRAKELYRVLRAKRAFQVAAAETENEGDRFEWLMSREEGRRALGVALRNIKKRHVASSMMDITTCGAVPPYSEVLAGKLVALLMASPQAIADYQERYHDSPSQILVSERKSSVYVPWFQDRAEPDELANRKQP